MSVTICWNKPPSALHSLSIVASIFPSSGLNPGSTKDAPRNRSRTANAPNSRDDDGEFTLSHRRNVRPRKRRTATGWDNRRGSSFSTARAKDRERDGTRQRGARTREKRGRRGSKWWTRPRAKWCGSSRAREGKREIVGSTRCVEQNKSHCFQSYFWPLFSVSVSFTLDAVVTTHVNTTRDCERQTDDVCAMVCAIRSKRLRLLARSLARFAPRRVRERICFPSFARTLTVGSLPPRHPLCGDLVPEIGIDDIRYAPDRYPQRKKRGETREEK